MSSTQLTGPFQWILTQNHAGRSDWDDGRWEWEDSPRGDRDSTYNKRHQPSPSPMLGAASPDARLASPWLDTPRSTSMLCLKFIIYISWFYFSSIHGPTLTTGFNSMSLCTCSGFCFSMGYWCTFSCPNPGFWVLCQILRLKVWWKIQSTCRL